MHACNLYIIFCAQVITSTCPSFQNFPFTRVSIDAYPEPNPCTFFTGSKSVIFFTQLHLKFLLRIHQYAIPLQKFANLLLQLALTNHISTLASWPFRIKLITSCLNPLNYLWYYHYHHYELSIIMFPSFTTTTPLACTHSSPCCYTLHPSGILVIVISYCFYTFIIPYIPHLPAVNIFK